MKEGPHKMIIQSLLLFLLVAGASHPAFAGPVEVQSIQIVPTETTVGRYPEITGSIVAHKVNAPGETLKIIIIASVVRPDHVVKSWTWKNVSMRDGDLRSFTIPKEYGMKLAGTYKVDFNVYSRDMLPMHRLSKTFVAVDQTIPSAKTITPKEDRARLEPATGQAAGHPAESEYPHFGVGLYADTLHSTGGATLLLLPFKYVGLQANYTEGSFTIAEGRILVRFPFSSGITPYLGAGFLNVSTKRSVEIIGIKTKFQDSGVSGVIGVEMPLGKKVFGCVEMSGSSIDLKKEVSNGAVTGTASVKYVPVTIGISIGYYLF
jgi:Outer membrane protein beta-barrel domain